LLTFSLFFLYLVIHNLIHFFLSDEGDEEELLLPPDDEIDPLIDSSAYSTNNFIQTAEDIDDIDIEENVDYITSDAA
jgi:hypothetical protein